MADININEYVRTISGNIDKVDALIGMIENTVHLEKHKWQDIKNIVKHSPNIIDLIEEGDYVNGYKVISIDKNVPDIHTDCIELDLNNNYQYNFITINQIKYIVTKKQMKSVEYIVKEEQ